MWKCWSLLRLKISREELAFVHVSEWRRKTGFKKKKKGKEL